MFITTHVPAGYYALNATLRLNKNLTVVGEGIVILDAKRESDILEKERLKLSVSISNIDFDFANGKCNLAETYTILQKDLDIRFRSGYEELYYRE